MVNQLELIKIYEISIQIANSNDQMVGEKSNLYVTIEQLHEILMRFAILDAPTKPKEARNGEE